jgi:hypothetical protein
MKYLHRHKGVRFCADSDLITDELIAAGFHDALTLPIPHLPPRSQRTPRHTSRTIGYFGGARLDKGFDLLGDLMESVFLSDNKASFVIQSRLFDNNPAVTAAKDRLEKLARRLPHRITLLDKYLSAEDYAAWMRKCSVVIVPYRSESYGKGTSGILAEAVACAAWAVVPENTWMSVQKQKYCRIVTFTEHTPQAICRAVLTCLDKLSQRDAVPIDSQLDNWYSFHSPLNYVDLLLGSSKRCRAREKRPAVQVSSICSEKRRSARDKELAASN